MGSVHNFSSPTGTGGLSRCANCSKQHDDGVLSTAQVPLTIPLYYAAASTSIQGIEGFNPGQVEPYLANQLHWVAVSVRSLQSIVYAL